MMCDVRKKEREREKKGRKREKEKLVGERSGVEKKKMVFVFSNISLLPFSGFCVFFLCVCCLQPITFFLFLLSASYSLLFFINFSLLSCTIVSTFMIGGKNSGDFFIQDNGRKGGREAILNRLLS